VDSKQIELRSKNPTQNRKEVAEANYEELMLIVRKPGWQTPAEFSLDNGVRDSTSALAKHLAGLEQTLLAGARVVATR
jgi:hypothetical protein